MTVTGVSSTSLNYQSNPLTDFRQTFMQMAKAINSGDLAGAQDAYASLSDMQGGSQSPTGANSPLGQALSQIGQDLQNGDITSAQQTLSSLKSQMHHAHHGHHRPQTDNASGAPTDSDPSQASGTTGSAVNLLA